ncbi:hypothetical protein T440DRAFT_139298 [Plenodomus tracheiphilus IPT5]|uniref:Uncharacterized protein n=1 Tax=Plenodomus tracheiphilus IPT5 TaxID=1408161 RepID=A0A6A7B0Z6_9PLEO|nr:hypothetical protein T440DRAFT_139298 [Plenodomus tracheiphilus IPT5]
MANRLPQELSRKCALVLLPPPSITAPIDAVRRLHDKQFNRWPTHINLLYPFVRVPSIPNDKNEPTLKEDIRARIEDITRNIPPTQVSLDIDTPCCSMHSMKRYSVWLSPTTQFIQTLQAALEAGFKKRHPNTRTFQPRLGIGHAHSGDGVDRIQAEIQNSVRNHLKDRDENAPLVLDWLIDRVSVIECKESWDRFEIIGTVGLGEQARHLS